MHNDRTAMASPTSFLEGMRLDHAAMPQLGRFLLLADAMLRRRGIWLSFDGIDQLAKLNAEHYDTWGRFAPQLDTRSASLGGDDAYCLIGRNQAGEIVAAQAGRIYSVGARTLQDIAEDRSLYYGRSMPPRGGLTCELTAAGAHTITGRFVYSGGLWVRPDHRGHKLAGLLPRVSRAYALGKFETDYTFAFIGEKMAASPLYRLYGYPRCEPAYTLFEHGRRIYSGSLMWMTTGELLADLADFDEQALAAA